MSLGLLDWQADFSPLSHQGSPTYSERQRSHLTKGMSHSTTHLRKGQETAGGQEGGVGNKNAILSSLITKTRRVKNLGVGSVECSCLSCTFFILLNIIKVEPCVYIPDLSDCISATLDDMKGQVKVMSGDNLPFWTSVLSWVKGDWWKTIFTIVIVALCCWKRVFAMTSVFSWQNSISLCPTSFRIPRPNLPVTPGVS